MAKKIQAKVVDHILTDEANIDQMTIKIKKWLSTIIKPQYLVQTDIWHLFDNRFRINFWSRLPEREYKAISLSYFIHVNPNEIKIC